MTQPWHPPIEERLLNVLTVTLGAAWNVCGSVTERLREGRDGF